ncbi:hypothetical protein ACFQU2_00735 [Siccirubricoccus deserti]
MDVPHQPELGEARRRLRRPDQRRGPDRQRRRGAGGLEKLRQMRRHCAGDEPWTSEGDGQQRHGEAGRWPILGQALHGGTLGRRC